MNTNDINHTNDVNISIAAAIAIRDNVNLLEKAVLARIAEFPACSNIGLAKLTGLSVRGVEALLARLRKLGLIRKVGEGRARRHQLTFPVECHTERGNTGVEESHTMRGKTDARQAPAVGECKREETTADFIDRHLAFYENCFNAGSLEYARKHLEQIRARLDLDTEIPADQKAKFIGFLVENENRCFALEVWLKMPKEVPRARHERLGLALSNAAPDKLALFRQQVEAGQLTNNAINILELTDG